MACGACAKKAAARQAAANKQVALPAAVTPVNPRPEPVVTSSGGFVSKRYVGPRQRVPSVLNNMSYGVRNPGEVLLIYEQDFVAHPEWWENV